MYRQVIAGLLFVMPVHWVSAEIFLPAVAVIIDDIGHNFRDGERVIRSRWPFACSIIPGQPYSEKLAWLAHQNGKEVMVHLPMQANSVQQGEQGGLTLDMDEREFMQRVNAGIDGVPFARGINNHKGSLLTRHVDQMNWLMQTIVGRDESFYFVDSRTTADTVAGRIAEEYRVPTLTRDVFLDVEAGDIEFIESQLRRLLKIARRQGYALAIGHPYDTTMQVLDRGLARLEEQGIRLVTVGELVEIARER